MQTGSGVGFTAGKALCPRLMLRNLCLWADLPNRISLLELLINVFPPRLRQQSRGQTTSRRRKRTSSLDSRIPFVISLRPVGGTNNSLQLAHSAVGGVGFGAGMCFGVLIPTFTLTLTYL